VSSSPIDRAFSDSARQLLLSYGKVIGPKQGIWINWRLQNDIAMDEISLLRAANARSKFCARNWPSSSQLAMRQVAWKRNSEVARE